MNKRHLSPYELGKLGEDYALEYLQNKKFHILEKSFRFYRGEIDIIAREKRTLVFVEVKSRSSKSFGSPKWAITPQKKRNLSKAALYYLKMTDQSGANARFDVVSILSNEDGMEIELIRNAFDLAYP